MSSASLRRALLPLVACLLALPGCLLQPANELFLGSTGQRVTFRWLSPWPESGSLTIEASASASGPFMAVDTVSPTGVMTVLNGAGLFEFEATVVIPDVYWTRTCAGSETFVRARAGDFLLTTFDDASVAGESGEECIANSPFFFPLAARECASPFGPRVRLTAPGRGVTSVGGDLEIVSPYQADDYACLESVGGDFVVSDSTDEDLAFPNLASVGGSLDLTYGYGGGAIREIDLPALETVGGSVALSLADLGSPGPVLSADFGLPVLDAVGGNVQITTAGVGSAQVSVAGLPLVTHIPGDLGVAANNGDNGYGNLLPLLAQVDGSVDASLGFSVTGGFDALTSVGGDALVSVNSWLNGNGGFDGLATVGGDFRFYGGSLVYADDFPALEIVVGDVAIEGFDTWAGMPGDRYLPQLALVGGTLRWHDTSDLLAPLGAPAVSVGGLELDANLGLADLPGSLAQLAIDPVGPITITGNSGITDCDAQSYVDGLPGHTGPVSIAGNDGC